MFQMKNLITCNYGLFKVRANTSDDNKTTDTHSETNGGQIKLLIKDYLAKEIAMGRGQGLHLAMSPNRKKSKVGWLIV